MSVNTAECIASFREYAGPWAPQSEIRILEGARQLVELDLKPPVVEARVSIDIQYDRFGKVTSGSIYIPTQTADSYVFFKTGNMGHKTGWIGCYPATNPSVEEKKTLPQDGSFRFREMSYRLAISLNHTIMALLIDKTSKIPEDPFLLFKPDRLAFSFRAKLDPVNYVNLITDYKDTTGEQAAKTVPHHYKSFQAVNS